MLSVVTQMKDGTQIEVGTIGGVMRQRNRVDVDSIARHQFLAMMLGTNRSGVTIAAATLQQAGFIKYAHGSVTILDRAGLENASCECYEVAREQFGGLLRRINGHVPKSL